MSTNNTYTTTVTYESRADQRRRQVVYLNWNNTLLARTAKGLVPAIKRSWRSKYVRHVGAKQLAKLNP